MIPALNEELTITDFVAWCREGLADGRRARRDPHRRQLDRPHRRAGPEPAAPGCCARPKRGLGRAYIDALPSIRGRWMHHGRRRLHLRLPPAGAVRRAVPRGLRVRHGLALEGLDRARLDAGAAPLLRHAGHDLDPEPSLLAASSPTSTAGCGASPATRSSAWTCSRSRGSTPRRWCSSRCTWSCARPRCRSRSSRTARAGSATTSARAGSRRSGGVDQPPGDVRLRADFFLLKPGRPARRARPAAHAAAELRRPHARAGHALAQLAVPRGDRARRRAARRSSSGASPRCCSTTPAARRDAG